MSIKKKKKKKIMSLHSTLPLRIDEGPNGISLLLPQDSLGRLSPPLFMSVRFLKKGGGEVI